MVKDKDLKRSIKRLESLKRQAEKDRLDGLADQLKRLIERKKRES